MMMNKVILIGYVGGEASVRQGGVVSLRLATTEKGYTKSTGEVVLDKTEWHNVKIFREDLRIWASKYIKKGDSIIVEGKIHYSTYTDTNGVERMGVEIIASNVSFFSLGRGKGADVGNMTTEITETRSSIADNLPF